MAYKLHRSHIGSTEREGQPKTCTQCGVNRLKDPKALKPCPKAVA